MKEAFALFNLIALTENLGYSNDKAIIKLLY